MFILKIEGQIRGGKNSMSIDPRTGRHFPGTRARQFVLWRNNAMAQVRAQIPSFWKPASVPMCVHIYYWRGDDRRRDSPMMEDALWHVLERSGVVEDDRLLIPHWYPQGLDRRNPRVLLAFHPFEHSPLPDEVAKYDAWRFSR